MTTLDRDVVEIAPPAAPRTAVLDSAHVGDIEGALGRISLSDTDYAFKGPNRSARDDRPAFGRAASDICGRLP